jgi:hypothetical protein
MTWDAIGALGEWAGALAVIATLIYLAIQIRQNSENLRTNAELEASRQFTLIVSRVSADPNMKRIWDEVADQKDLSLDDQRDYSWLLAEFFHAAEGVYVQYAKGLLSADIWGVYERMMVGLLQHDTAHNWWHEVAAPFSDGFRDHVETLKSQSSGWNVRSVSQTQAANDTNS